VANRKKRKLASRKVYPIDTGLVNAVRFDFSKEYGRALESLVFIELKRREKELYYHENDGECDFIIKEGRDFKTVIQVTKTLEDTREREVRGLESAMKSHDIEKGLILTENEKQSFDGNIEVMPVWLCY